MDLLEQVAALVRAAVMVKTWVVKIQNLAQAQLVFLVPKQMEAPAMVLLGIQDQAALEVDLKELEVVLE
nr:hypothetical protein BaRGS_024089 [Batillaria attramentaria]KAG5691069.1 hypothetical protein BaRGS_027573 [Batillaria attramentaria]